MNLKIDVSKAHYKLPFTYDRGLRGASLFFILITISLMLNAPFSTHLSAGDNIPEKIERERKELERLKRQIEERKKKAKEAARKERSILWNIEESDYRLGIMRKELRLFDWQLKEKERDIASINNEIGYLRSEIDKKRGLLKNRLRVAFKHRRGGYLQLLFASRDYSTLMRRYKYTGLIIDKEAGLINSYKEDLERIGLKKIELEKGRQEILYYKKNLTAKEDEIKAEREKKISLLGEVRSEKEQYNTLVKELEESASELKAIINQLSQKKDTLSLADGRFKEAKGRLKWPVEGNIAGFFGRQRHPKFNTYIIRKGIDIAAKEGTAIKAVFSGKVVYADWFRGYGMLIILEHSDGYYTVYGNASRLTASVGDSVAVNQVIAEVGDSGVSRQGNLYFEIRYMGDPQDPMQWLTRR